MHIKYHPDIDALSIRLKGRSDLPTDTISKSDTIKIGHDTIICLGHDGNLQSIEILNASQHVDDVENLHILGLIPKIEQPEA